ncbi:MAG: hypothetical protein NUV57_03565 [archaeon]|nr:hypothetical protein [archaeon]
MDRDKIIALVLVVGLVFLFVALIGVVTVTGFVLFFVTSDQGTVVDNTPLIDTNPNTAVNTANTDNTAPNTNTTPNTNTNPNNDPDPVCGNNDLETDEQCEADSDCSSSQICNSSCDCEAKPEPEAELLSNIKVESLTYWCATDFEGEKGLAVKIVKFKNTGTSDFNYNNKVTLKSESESADDSITTNAAYKFAVKAGKTTDIYQKDFFRSTAPYLYIGNTLGKVTLTFEFGKDFYFEHNLTLKGQDFASANCQ